MFPVAISKVANSQNNVAILLKVRMWLMDNDSLIQTAIEFIDVNLHKFDFE